MHMLKNVSIVFPIRNEAEFIAQSLEAVCRQTYPHHLMQVLVMDGMSTDNTREIVQETAAKYPDVNVQIIDNPGKAVPTAFNISLKHATGDMIMLVSGHCIVAPDYVARCVKAMQDTGADNVGGRLHAVGTTPIARAIALATTSPFGVGNAQFRYATQPGWVDTVYLGAYSRDVLERVGGYDEELIRNQDDELNFRIVQSGGKIWFDPEIKSTYYSRASFGKLWKQYFQYGMYKVLVMKKRGGVASWRHLIPVTFVVTLLLTEFLGYELHLPTLMLAVPVPYLLANLAASIWTARHNWATLPSLPIAFAILHFAYGFGWLAGFWKWRDWRMERAT